MKPSPPKAKPSTACLSRRLLEVTDNRVRGAIVPPSDTVRFDQDDPYLVVAADKGTATFSDIANSIAVQRGFWLGDAFASGGSNGYDHKKMGITAKGAFEAVKRHFYEMGHDMNTQPITMVGVGDMSGDVFGNGVLLSRQLKVLAAFDHRHIFLDPTPDVAVSFAERQRMFALPRSSWEDYDKSLISAGGGVYPRSARSIALSPEIRAALDIAETALAPEELMHRILLAPVDLFYNGGIGTYIKASTESHAQVKDRANDNIRVDGNALRCKVVSEGGNLGATQNGRIEFALAGGRIFTDAIDNSAGVDCSDHEVNVKIWLDTEVNAGELPEADRNRILNEMTGEIERLVLRDNELQTHLLVREVQAQVDPSVVDGYAALIASLEAGRRPVARTGTAAERNRTGAPQGRRPGLDGAGTGGGHRQRQEPLQTPAGAAAADRHAVGRDGTEALLPGAAGGHPQCAGPSAGQRHPRHRAGQRSGQPLRSFDDPQPGRRPRYRETRPSSSPGAKPGPP